MNRLLALSLAAFGRAAAAADDDDTAATAPVTAANLLRTSATGLPGRAPRRSVGA
jgi:hypothetical protein